MVPGFSEPDAGSDLASLRTTAVRDGDEWVVNGQKTWTTLAQYADWIFALVRTNPEAKKQAGISFMLIDLQTPGVTVRPIQMIDGRYEVNEVFFDNVRVPLDQLVGEENRGWDYAKFLLGNERVGVAPVGSIKRKLATVKTYAKSVVGEGDRTLLDDPTIAARIAELECRPDGARADRDPGRRRFPRRQAEPGLVDPEAARLRAPTGGPRARRRRGRADVALLGRRRVAARTGRRSRRRRTSTSARPPSTAVPAKCNDRSLPAASWD